MVDRDADVHDGRAAADEHSHPDEQTDHMSGFPSLRTLHALRSSFPSSFTSFYTPSSLLFGSTTRPATRARPAPEETTQESVIRRRTATQSDVRVTEQLEASENEGVRAEMAAKSHLWITLWFAITAPIIAWDVGYCFMR